MRKLKLRLTHNCIRLDKHNFLHTAFQRACAIQVADQMQPKIHKDIHMFQREMHQQISKSKVVPEFSHNEGPCSSGATINVAPFHINNYQLCCHPKFKKSATKNSKQNISTAFRMLLVTTYLDNLLTFQFGWEVNLQHGHLVRNIMQHTSVQSWFRITISGYWLVKAKIDRKSVV